MRGDGSVYRRGGRWWISYWRANQRFRESAGTTEAAARRLLRQRRNEILTERFVAPDAHRPTVGELLDQLVLHLRMKGARSLVACASHLKAVRFAFGLRRADELTTPDIHRYIQQRLDAGRARATVNRETGLLRQAFNLAVRQTPPLVQRVPYIPALKEDNARQGFFERDEFEAVCQHLPPHLAEIARFAYMTGWRRGEIVPLRWDAVDLQAREVRLRTSKSGHPRTLPLSGALWSLIEQRLAQRAYAAPHAREALSEYVFHAGDGHAVVDFKRSWKTACQRAGCPERLFHDLRRTAIRDMIRAGVPQSVAMRISGHRTTAVFLRYDITSEDDKRDALLRLERHREGLAEPRLAPLPDTLEPPDLPAFSPPTRQR